MSDNRGHSQNKAEDAYLKSMFYAQLVEHVFVSEVLQEVWYAFGQTVEVLRSEIDSSGHDVVFDCNGIVRHVQLKTSKGGAKASFQKVNTALEKKPGGCVVWAERAEVQHRLELSYRFFGGDPGRPISLDGLEVAKHTKRDAEGVQGLRPAIRVVPKNLFGDIIDIRELVEKLFGKNALASGS
ncbi:MAG TPA: hypothetical protein VHY91_20850 [Pirellulales bacterium]|jgi:hypothetical protein|nr:hypothetical protein [Pirellulales bacterium]